MVRAIAELQDAGVEPVVWKIEGLDRREDCERVVPSAGPADVIRWSAWFSGAAPARQSGALATSGAGVDGYVGFAIGRSIWGEPLAGFLDGT